MSELSDASNSDSLKFDASTHYRFGANWSLYSELIDDRRIQAATNELERYLGRENVAGRSILDIGCGSGLHSLAAIRLGAKEVTAIDFDPLSVATAKRVLSQTASGAPCEVLEGNVFTLSLPKRFDVVYAWGVLHHTGAMWEAIAKAADFVAPTGIFAIAIYQRTIFCPAWKQIKRVYANSPAWVQFVADWFYMAASLLRQVSLGINPVRYVRDYHKNRGMAWRRDVSDWMGGYPYESATPEEIISFLKARGFEFIGRPPSVKALPWGLFGSGCVEYLFRRR